MKEEYIEYIKLRGTEDPKRLRLKADLARKMSENGGSWLLERYKGRGYGFGETYGEVARKLSDGQSIPDRREPSLAEAVLASLEMKKDYQRLLEILLPRSRAIIKIGSSSWAENYDVRMDPNDPSDLDLEVIMDEVEPKIGEGIPGAVEGLTLFKKYYDAGKADYFSFGLKMGNRPVSIHFMPRKVFEKNCAVDYEHLGEDEEGVISIPAEKIVGGKKKDVLIKARVSREFRAKPKSKPAVYDERYDGTGEEYIYTGQPQIQEEGGMITEVPVMMVGNDGKLIMGLVMSKYFGYPVVEGDRLFFEEQVIKFKESVARRLVKEGGKFGNMPGRKNRMPYYLLDRLNAEQKTLIK